MSATNICNLALGRIGSKRINNIETDNTVEAIQCRIHYAQTRDALIRSHWWRFATKRAELSQDITDPAFGWNNQFVLPVDFLRLKRVYSNDYPTKRSFSIEGDRILTNEDTVNITYIALVEDTSKFDALFIEVLVLRLAIKLVMPLAQDNVLRRDLSVELQPLMSQVRTIDFQEQNNTGRNDHRTWNDARYRGSLGIDDSRLGS